MRTRDEKYLLELTGLPTAAGCEQRVVAWVERWARRRRSVDLSRDRYGNLLLKRAGARSRRPIIFTAHMDHPAFVVKQQVGPREVLTEFRGGVEDRYFVGSRVRLHLTGADPCKGRVTRLDTAHRRGAGNPGAGGDKRAWIELARPVVAKGGDVLTWDLPAPRVVRGRLRAPACDDLAGVAAAIAAFEVLLKVKPGRAGADVRVLLTRAEEVGFIGAIAACRSGIIPRAARLIALETSKSFADSPIGGGPIVRVGDRTSSFDPDLTYKVGGVAQHIEREDPGFKWQRRLMPGGTCEASAYQALGFTSTCLCLPLGNYHNMNAEAARVSGRTSGKRAAKTSRGRIDSEVISLADYHGLVRLLVEAGRSLDRGDLSPPLRDRMGKLFARRRGLLG
jgi:putative aminopeptidase FrvX